MRSGGLNRGQRIVIVIGMAAALSALGGWITTRGGGRQFGWVAYAPLSNTYNTPEGPGGLHPWVRLVIWLALIMVWAITSVLVLRSQGTNDGGSND